MRTIFQNVKILTPFRQQAGVVVVQGRHIQAVCGHAEPAAGDAVIDGGGLYLAPGFIDLHVHGGGGHSVMAGTREAIVGMAQAHLAMGTTSLLPTTFSAPLPQLVAAAQAVSDAIAEGVCRANILGLHLEGPCLSAAQAGAQPPGALLIPAHADLSPLMAYLPILRMMGIAPELEGALVLGERLAAQGVVVSVAHSDADYDTVISAIGHGFSDVTHLYSGCSSVVRRDAFRVAGVVEAGLERDDLTVQAIADGCHLPPALLRLIYRCKGADGMYAVTDGLEYSAAPIVEGMRYRQQNGVETLYEDGVMKLADRSAFAGSVATMARLVRVLRGAGIPLTDAVRMATDTPATRIGALGKGRIAPGYDADIVLFDESIDVRLCMVSGQVVVQRN